MTGASGMTEQSMKNMITTIDPNGGILIFSEGSSLFGGQLNTMWRVHRNRDKAKVDLLHSSLDK